MSPGSTTRTIALAITAGLGAALLSSGVQGCGPASAADSEGDAVERTSSEPATANTRPHALPLSDQFRRRQAEAEAAVDWVKTWTPWSDGSDQRPLPELLQVRVAYHDGEPHVLVTADANDGDWVTGVALMLIQHWQETGIDPPLILDIAFLDHRIRRTSSIFHLFADAYLIEVISRELAVWEGPNNAGADPWHSDDELLEMWQNLKSGRSESHETAEAAWKGP